MGLLRPNNEACHDDRRSRVESYPFRQHRPLSILRDSKKNRNAYLSVFSKKNFKKKRTDTRTFTPLQNKKRSHYQEKQKQKKLWRPRGNKRILGDGGRTVGSSRAAIHIYNSEKECGFTAWVCVFSCQISHCRGDRQRAVHQVAKCSLYGSARHC